MIKVIVILMIIVAVVTIFSVKDSKEKKWPVIVVTTLLFVELILCIYNGESKFIHKITGIEFVLILIVLWILSIAPHVDDTNEKSEKDCDTKTD